MPVKLLRIVGKKSLLLKPFGLGINQRSRLASHARMIAVNKTVAVAVSSCPHAAGEAYNGIHQAGDLALL